jgi:hypothetical protein
MPTIIMGPQARKIRATIGNRVALSPDHPDIPRLRTDYDVERLAEHVEVVLSRTPKPTAEQINRLARLLKAGGN